MKRYPGAREILLVALLSSLVIFNYYLPSYSLAEMVAQDALLFLILPGALVWFILREPLGLYNIQAGDLGKGLKYTCLLILLALPGMIIGAGMASFQAYYPLWSPAAESLGNYLYFEALIGIRMLATEAMFRGFLLVALVRLPWALFGLGGDGSGQLQQMGSGLAYNQLAGNFLHAFIYALVHIGKPTLEVYYSFFAGLLFGWVALRCKSILPSFAVHWSTSMAFDAMVIYHKL